MGSYYSDYHPLELIKRKKDKPGKKVGEWPGIRQGDDVRDTRKEDALGSAKMMVVVGLE